VSFIGVAKSILICQVRQFEEMPHGCISLSKFAKKERGGERGLEKRWEQTLSETLSRVVAVLVKKIY